MNNCTMEIYFTARSSVSVPLSNALLEEVQDGYTLHADCGIEFSVYNNDLLSQSHNDDQDVFMFKGCETPSKITLDWH